MIIQLEFNWVSGAILHRGAVIKPNSEKYDLLKNVPEISFKEFLIEIVFSFDAEYGFRKL